MFVKNMISIKRQTISVDDEQKIYLVRNGYSPISKEENKWVYIRNESIINLINCYKGGDG